MFYLDDRYKQHNVLRLSSIFNKYCITDRNDVITIYAITIYTRLYDMFYIKQFDETIIYSEYIYHCFPYTGFKFQVKDSRNIKTSASYIREALSRGIYFPNHEINFNQIIYYILSDEHFKAAFFQFCCNSLRSVQPLVVYSEVTKRGLNVSSRKKCFYLKKVPMFLSNTDYKCNIG